MVGTDPSANDTIRNLRVRLDEALAQNKKFREEQEGDRKNNDIARSKAITALSELIQGGEAEMVRATADDVLCVLLRSIGYADVVEAYDHVERSVREAIKKQLPS